MDNRFLTVFSFYRCVYHFCQECYGTARSPRTNIPFKVSYKKTIEQERRIREAGYNLVVVWEHSLQEILNKNPEARDKVMAMPIHERLDPR